MRGCWMILVWDSRNLHGPLGDEKRPCPPGLDGWAMPPCFSKVTAARVLIDPFLTGNPKAAAKADEVPADLILISHGHGDHVGDAVAIAQRTGATVATNYEISEWLQQPPEGLTKVEGLQHGGSFVFDKAVRVKLTLAFHGSAAARTAAMAAIPAVSLSRSPTASRSTTPRTRHFSATWR